MALSMKIEEGMSRREEETTTMDLTIPGKTSFEIVQETRAVSIKELERKEDPFTIFEILYKPGSVPKRELVKNFVSIRYSFLFLNFNLLRAETPEEGCQG